MNRIDSVTIAPTTRDKTTPGRFESALQGAADALARSVAGAVDFAAPVVPFGTVLSGAVRGGGKGGADPTTPLDRPDRTLPLGEGADGAGSGGTPGTGSGSGSDLLEATRAMQQEAQAMNLQYLQLQEKMQQESREYQALSNVMKTKHDSARTAISNIH